MVLAAMGHFGPEHLMGVAVMNNAAWLRSYCICINFYTMFAIFVLIYRMC